MELTKVNKWERDGIGTAPFRCVGVAELPSRALLEAGNVHGYNNAMRSLPLEYGLGTCYVCGMALTVNYLIRDAKGKKFAVGCECVKKTGDTVLTSDMKEKRLARDRAKRAEKREAKRIARYAASAARDYEREINNWGLHPLEANYIIREALRERNAAILGELAELLDDRRGGFRESVAEGLRKGNLPSGRGLSIMLEILGKLKGRKNSKAYNAEVARIESIIAEVE